MNFVSLIYLKATIKHLELRIKIFSCCLFFYFFSFFFLLCTLSYFVRLNQDEQLRENVSLAIFQIFCFCRLEYLIATEDRIARDRNIPLFLLISLFSSLITIYIFILFLRTA